MCILCHSASLRLLVAPLDSLSHLDLSESVRVAREAAMQLVLDTTDTAGELENSGAILDELASDTYIEYVVERAERDVVATSEEVSGWNASAEDGSIYLDPRVQAFLSSAAEGLSTYVVHIQDQRAVLERFLEVPSGRIEFAGIGASGEVMFDLGPERYIVLSDEEALQIAIDRVSLSLHDEDPTRLLPYTSLPDAAVEVLAAAQTKGQDEANDILSGIVDLRALAEDVLRQHGYAQLVLENLTQDHTEQRFGDRVIIRLRPAELEAGEQD